MIVERINKESESLVIDLLKNVNGLKIEESIMKNCLVLLNDNKDIVGTISYEQFNNYALVRYFVFKRNIDYKDLLLLYNSLEKELNNKRIEASIAIINSNEVKTVFKYLGFNKIDKKLIYFDETVFTKTNYKDNDVYIKKIN